MREPHIRCAPRRPGKLRAAPSLASRPYLAASIARRNAYLDMLSHVQIEALLRRRARAAESAETAQLSRIVYTTIGGIAAGL